MTLKECFLKIFLFFLEFWINCLFCFSPIIISFPPHTPTTPQIFRYYFNYYLPETYLAMTLEILNMTDYFTLPNSVIIFSPVHVKTKICNTVAVGNILHV